MRSKKMQKKFAELEKEERKRRIAEGEKELQQKRESFNENRDMSSSYERQSEPRVAKANIAGIEVIATDTLKANDNTEQKHNTEENIKKPKKKKSFKTWFKGLKTWKKVLYISGVSILVIAIAAVSIVFDFLNNVMDEVTPEEDEEVDFDDFELSIEPVDGFINILLLGIDDRDMTDFNHSRTDMMIVASINTETYEVKLTSIYRDVLTKLGSTSTYQRMNTGIVFGGIKLELQTINQSLDLDIDKYVIVNWGIVAEAVDLLGGIEVELKPNEIKEFNNCIVDSARVTGKPETHLYESGLQTLNGVQALAYGRMRYDVGGDTKRTERQRVVISKCVEKIKTMKLKDIKQFIYKVAPMVRTNMKMTDVLALGVNVNKYSVGTGDGWPYNYCFGYYEGMSILYPTTLRSNVVAFHEKVFGQTDYTPSAKVCEISNHLEELRTTPSTEDDPVEPDPSEEGGEEPDPSEEGGEEPDPSEEGGEEPDPSEEGGEEPDPSEEGGEGEVKPGETIEG